MPPAADPARASALFALVLDELPGVGAVTAGRLLRRFPTLADVRRTPREQVLARVQGAPHAERLVALLFDEKALAEPLGIAQAELDRLHERRIEVLTPGHPAWPIGVEDLPRSDRPHRLFAFGHAEAARQVRLSVAGAGSEPLPSAAEGLLRRLDSPGRSVALGGLNRFRADLVDAFEESPVVVVLGCGLAKMDRTCRSAASALVHRGGLLLSPFPLAHGPFAHDDRSRAYVQAALATTTLSLGPLREGADAHALTWAANQRRSVFGFAEASELPEGAHPLRSAVDAEWIEAALRVQASEPDAPGSVDAPGA